jgi:hypothetical protein
MTFSVFISASVFVYFQFVFQLDIIINKDTTLIVSLEKLQKIVP